MPFVLNYNKMVKTKNERGGAMGDIENRTDLPPSFEKALQPNYLGSPKVVSGILEKFVGEIRGWVVSRGLGIMTAKEMVSKIHERSHDFAEIFSGQNPDYIPVVGWNSPIVGLSQYLKIDLGHYWQSNRAEYDDDAIRVFYGWLVWAVADGMMKGQDDEDLTAVIVGSRIKQAIEFLTGTVKRH